MISAAPFFSKTLLLKKFVKSRKENFFIKRHKRVRNFKLHFHYEPSFMDSVILKNVYFVLDIPSIFTWGNY